MDSMWWLEGAALKKNEMNDLTKGKNKRRK